VHDVVRNRTRRVRARPPFECIALLLQRGGALGAYQAGVYQALAEVDLHPDWVAGISIGAINSAIAGNPPEDRVTKLRAFWERRAWVLYPSPTGTMAATGRLPRSDELRPFRQRDTDDPP
jgi:NTE family protein